MLSPSRAGTTLAAGALALALPLFAACAGEADPSGGAVASPDAPDGDAPAACVPGDGGITLPDGFCAAVFADGLAGPRHLAVAPNGDVFVALAGSRGAAGGVLALRDEDGDGAADARVHWEAAGGTGIALVDGWVYFGPDDAVLRFPRAEGALEASGSPETIVSGLPSDRGHAAKSIAVTAEALYVNVGSPSNSCQVQERTNGSPGRDPCPELQTRAGIWRFDPDRPGQRQADGTRFATGIRNAVAIAAHPATGDLYALQHGRDQLHQNWGELYDAEAGAEKPAEELLHVTEGSDFGWPYCYYDRQLDRRVLAPEYGGDGQQVGRCAEKGDPLYAFPGHWAPNALVFYDDDAFPARYRGGAFIAFHGSWNRSPLPQAGYNVVFLPFADGRPSGAHEVFADGFAGDTVGPGEADHRPTGLAVGPDGALYVSDDQGGRIWRILPRPGA